MGKRKWGVSMMKNILLNYVMGKYRKIIVIFMIILTTVNAVRVYILFNSQISFGFHMLSFFAYIPFLFAIYNVPILASESVNNGSSDWDILCRVCYVFGSLILLFGIIYITFIPKILLES